MLRSISLAALAVGLLAPPALSPNPLTSSIAARHAARTRRTDDIVVTGVAPRDRRRARRRVGARRRRPCRAIRPTLGETLASQPGVSTSGSDPTRRGPVLRGLVGRPHPHPHRRHRQPRRIARRADHAVAINPLTADSIEVLHGPAALAVSGRRRSAAWSMSSTRASRAASRARRFSAEGMPATPPPPTSARQWRGRRRARRAFRRARRRQLDQERRPAHRRLHPRQAAARARPRASADADIRALADLKGELPNSAAAASRARARWPMSTAGSTSAPRSAATPPLRRAGALFARSRGRGRGDRTSTSTRPAIDARAEVPLGGAFRQVRLRGGYSNYNHAEVERRRRGRQPHSSPRAAKGGSTSSSTTASGWGGAVGRAISRHRASTSTATRNSCRRRRSARSACSRSSTSTRRAAARGRRAVRALTRLSADAERGGRQSRPQPPLLDLVAVGRGELRAVAAWKLGLNLARSQRAPSSEELFANGPHGGNASFQVGDPDLDIERSLGFEASIKHEGPRARRRRTALRQPLSQIILPGPDRRDRSTICRSMTSARAAPPIAGSRSRPRPGSARRRDRLGGRRQSPTRPAQRSRVSARRR